MLRDTDTVCLAGEIGISANFPEDLSRSDHRIPHHNYLLSRNSVNIPHVID